MPSLFFLTIGFADCNESPNKVIMLILGEYMFLCDCIFVSGQYRKIEKSEEGDFLLSLKVS